ncbi:hypothetical protein [Wolbachia endosymbiont (group B) of Hofmannophila pseudospretella]|uniref:hypothetical protein n=1 Tax=Wolbachia endosymbiont (group B) of Hofmannophila pseudospretella TaxID=3066177 RepID=UPI003342B8EE
MPFIPLYFIYFSITSFPLLSICSLYSGNWYKLQQHDIDMYNQWKEDGFDINANSFDGSNLLCLASESGCVKVVEFLRACT